MKQGPLLRHVALLEEDELIRRSLEWLLGQCHPSTRVVGAFSNPAALFASLSGIPPEILTLPANPKGFTVAALLPQVCQRLPETRVLIIATSEDARATIDAIRAGAQACILMGRILEELGPAIDGLGRGERWFCPQAASWLAFAHLAHRGEPPHAFHRETQHCPLSARELLVLRERSLHLSYKEIGCNHDISPDTARWYANQARQKLNARSVADALRLALRAGWIHHGRTEGSRAPGLY